MKYILSCLALILPLVTFSGPENDPDFSHSVTTKKKPWTDKDFRNNPDHFQFAILSDRTGGLRPGVFPAAVKKLNELQPEFVITVGDLIAGRSTKTELRDEWKEFNAFLENFEMPFFYLPGNHDMKDPTGTEVWDEHFGSRHYAFVYKKVLFLCLNSQDGKTWRPPLIGPEQIAWAKKELARHKDVRWTMVFIHQPVWLSEEGIILPRKGKEILNRHDTGWPEIEAALKGRNHTVFAGHVHHYVKYRRNQSNYYTLGTTGGGSRMRGPTFGEFDHATWVTMTDKGPRILNITIDGMLTEDVHSEGQHALWRSLYFQEYIRDTWPLSRQPLTLKITNPFDHQLDGRLNWILPFNDDWQVTPTRVNVQLQPGETRRYTFTLSYQGDPSRYFPAPLLNTHFTYPDSKEQLQHSIPLPLDYEEHSRKHPRTATSVELVTPAPKIDGDLSDAAWRDLPSLSPLLPKAKSGYASASTEIRITHDSKFLYFGVTCHEPVPDRILTRMTEPDSEVSTDDSIELFFDANMDKQIFNYLAVNRAGVIRDSRRTNPAWQSKTIVATGGSDRQWTVELAIPIDRLEADLNQHKHWGFQILRNRPYAEEIQEWNPNHGKTKYSPSQFGRLSFMERPPK